MKLSYLHKSFLTFKTPMKLLALFVIAFLVGATILYFYDTLFAAWRKLSWNGAKIVSQQVSNLISWLMAIIIGLGVLAESAPTIWEKLIYWGQCLDNKIMQYKSGQKYFIDEANELLEKVRLLINQANLYLQSLTYENCSKDTSSHMDCEKMLEKVCKNHQRIKEHCTKINKILENNEAEDTLNQGRQEKAKNILNSFVTANLQISDRIEALIKKHEVY